MEHYILQIAEAPLWLGYTIQSLYAVLSLLCLSFAITAKSKFDFVIYTLVCVLSVVASLATANGLGILS